MKLKHEIIDALILRGPLRTTEIAKLIGKRRAETAAACLYLINAHVLTLTPDLRVAIN